MTSITVKDSQALAARSRQILLRRRDGWTYDQIAAELDITRSRAKHLYDEAVSKLIYIELWREIEGKA